MSHRHMLVLTNDTFTFTLPDSVAARCTTLRQAPGRGGSEVVPLPNVSSHSLVRIVQFYTKAAELGRQEAHADTVQEWKTTFFSEMPRHELYELMEATNYLGATEMMDDACAYIRKLIKGRTPEEIREIFLMPVDRTAEETQLVAAELQWALK